MDVHHLAIEKVDGKVHPPLNLTTKKGNIKLRGVFKKHAIKSRGGYN